MNDQKNIKNIKSFLSAIDKMNPYHTNHSNIRKFSKQKENHTKKMNQTEECPNPNLFNIENNLEYNNLMFDLEEVFFLEKRLFFQYQEKVFYYQFFSLKVDQ